MDYNKALSVLELDSNFSEESLKKSYRTMSRRYHPDIAGDTFESKFKEIAEAYRFLKDPSNHSALKGVFTHSSLFTVVKN